VLVHLINFKSRAIVLVIHVDAIEAFARHRLTVNHLVDREVAITFRYSPYEQKVLNYLLIHCPKEISKGNIHQSPAPVTRKFHIT